MSRISAASAYQSRCAVFALRSEGLGYKQIAARLSMSVGSVRNFLASPAPLINPQTLLEEAVSLKLEQPDLGPSQILDKLAAPLGFDRAQPPISESGLQKLFSPARLNIANKQINHRGDDKPLYWLCAYDAPRKAYQIDTVKVVLANKDQVEIFTCIDVYSRAMWAEVMPRDASLEWCLKRCFDALGVPEMVSADNGLGFNLDSRRYLSGLVKYAFERGVKVFHFIPVAAPWHNSIVERYHRTMKRGDWLHRGREVCNIKADVPAWLNAHIHYYNTVKSHSALGGTTKRTTPAKIHGTYTHLDVVPHVHTFTASAAPVRSGIVSYTRRVNSRGFARVDAPEMLFDVRTSSAFGHLVRFNLDVSNGEGTVYRFGTHPGEVVPIGTFQHEINGSKTQNGYIPVQLLPGVVFEPLPFDEEVELERQRKHLRKGARLPLPSGFQYVSLPDGEWEVHNKYGRVITTSQHLIVDHRSEILGDGW